MPFTSNKRPMVDNSSAVTAVAGAMLITVLWRQRSGRFQPASSLLLTDVESLAD
jgi:hypothetical protein